MKYYVIFKKSERATYVVIEEQLDYVAKAKAIKIARELMKHNIPAVVVKRLDKLAIELLNDEAKRLSRSKYDVEDEDQDNDDNYLDSKNAEMAAERYCMSHA